MIGACFPLLRKCSAPANPKITASTAVAKIRLNGASTLFGELDSQEKLSLVVFAPLFMKTQYHPPSPVRNI